jgi:predicted nucleic acid-binding protein
VIYLDSCALLKFVRKEDETDHLRAWRGALPAGTELVTSEISELELSRTLYRAGLGQRAPYIVAEALKGLHTVGVTSAILTRAATYRLPRLGSLDAIHLATAEPFHDELTAFVTYDRQLARAAAVLGLPVSTPA